MTGKMSFISEHSAEYILVPQFANILSLEYQHVIPIYFWSTREGSNLSKSNFHNKKVKVVAMYPRRPKIDPLYPGKILATINHEIYQRTEYLESKGIPTFAGVPLIESMDEISLSSKCGWFNLSSGEEKMYMTKETGGISTELIVNLVEKNAKQMDWVDAIEVLKNNKDSINDGTRTIYIRRYMFGDRYKPVYFIIF